MLTRKTPDLSSPKGLIEKLSLQEEPYDNYYVAPSREDYFAIVTAALNGKLDGVVTVRRSGVYLDNFLINPPAEV